MSDTLVNDIDPIETQDWLSAVDSLIRAEGAERAHYIINQVIDQARNGGVKIAKGAKVKNCVLMQDTIVGEGTKLEYIISDKNVKITDGKELKGDEAFPVFVAKGQVV